MRELVRFSRPRPHGPTELDQDTDRVEPHILPARIAPHVNLDHTRRRRETLAASSERARLDYFGSGASGTYQRMTWYEAQAPADDRRCSRVPPGGC
jgi:hypothetical protein